MDKNDEVEITDEDIKEDEFEPDVLESDETDWKAEAQKLKGIAQRRATKLAKLKAIPKVEKKEETIKKTSSDLDYGQLGYLAAKGIESDEEIAIIQNAMSRTGEDLRTILKDEFVQSRLKNIKEAKDVAKATPSGTKRGSGTGERDVNYYLAKDEMPPAEKPLLRREYVNAKMKQEEAGSKFSDTPLIV